MDKAYDRAPTLRSRELRNNPTPAEEKLWSVLSNRQLKLDGGQHAINADADTRRAQFLESRGYRVIRFWNNDVLENIEVVVATIKRAMADSPSPTPPVNDRGL